MFLDYLQETLIPGCYRDLDLILIQKMTIFEIIFLFINISSSSTRTTTTHPAVNLRRREVVLVQSLQQLSWRFFENKTNLPFYSWAIFPNPQNVCSIKDLENLNFNFIRKFAFTYV